MHLSRVWLFLVAALVPAIAHAACPSPIPANLTKVTHVVTTVLSLKVDKYSWYDSQCLLRTASLKQEGGGNPGHGGYAVRMTYQIPGSPAPTTITVNQETTSDGGFGYFVSHERYRTFADNAFDTIAHHIFGVDDSPLGLDFAATGTVLTPTTMAAAHRFATTYHHYGTITPIATNADGNYVTNAPTSKSAYARYPIPVTLTWVFQAQTDAPRYDVDVDLTQVGAPDLVGFDLRAPYGVMVFDNGRDGTVQKIQWGDRYQFANHSFPLTRDSTWTWNGRNAGARYNAMIASGYEMGLYEPVPFSRSALADNYADERGSTSALYNHGHGCESGETELLPCDYEWPYQGAQFSLPTNSNTTPTNFKKIAWGSTAFYGTGSELTKVFDTSTTSEAFLGFPASQHIRYSICILLGKTIAGGLTHAAALATKPNCAAAVFN